MKRLTSVLVVLMLAAVALIAHPVEEFATPEAKGPVTVQLLFTGDIHGAIVDSQYSKGDGNSISGSGLSMISTLIKAQREENANTILVDGGDTIQGTPFTYYYAFFNQDVEDPTMKALGYLGYDAWNLGNHEFNYGIDILNKQIADAKSEGIEVITANFLASGTDSYESYAGAYIIREFDGVKVGVIGMDTPNIPTWDKPANWAGIDFRTFVDCWNHYADVLKNEEGCDVVIAFCHSGVGKTGGELVDADQIANYNGDGLYYDGSYENQIGALIENTTGIDLVVGSHTHESGSHIVLNAEGKEVPVIFAGSKANNLGKALITVEDGEVTDISFENLSIKGVEADAEFVANLQDYETEVWANYLDKVIGTATGDFMGPGKMTEANAFLDLVNKVQLEAIPEEVGAQISISAPLNTNSGAVIPEGDIKLGLLFQLYQYENWLYCIDMTGAELKAWMEFAATKYTVQDGEVTKGGGMYCDTLYGDGVSYEIYMGNPEGDRVRNITYKNEPISMDEHYKVVINNYRFTGGGYYMSNAAQYLGAESFAGDESRVYYSTQYDMEQGEDLGQVRNLLAAYIEKTGTLEPVVTSSFSIFPGASN